MLNQKERLENISFNIFKFNNKVKPDKKDTLLLSCLSEFGCETVGVQYVIPRILQENKDKYTIAVGWYGREYLYRHLVDEFWEIKEEHQWLRDYCRAFHHDSKNLTNLENGLYNFGGVVKADGMGKYAVGAKCLDCNKWWAVSYILSSCPNCQGKDIEQSMFGDIATWRKKVTRIPLPSQKKMDLASKYVSNNCVGVFARGRKTYGRNLQPEFYVKLLELLKSMGYDVVWLGEKQCTQPCPSSDVLDYSRLPECKDLELTFAIVKNLKFTIQFWTASTRLAGMLGVPYLLFESPDQLWGNGQEGLRRKLCDFGPSKLVAAHYLDMFEDNEKALQGVSRAIKEMAGGNFEDIILSTEDTAKSMKAEFEKKVKHE